MGNDDLSELIVSSTSTRLVHRVCVRVVNAERVQARCPIDLASEATTNLQYDCFSFNFEAV